MKHRSFSFRLIVAVAAIAYIFVIAIALMDNRAEGVAFATVLISVLASGILFLIVSSLVVGRFAMVYAFDYASCQDESDCYERALLRAGEAPIKALGSFLVLVLAFLGVFFAFVARGFLQAGSVGPLFCFTLSWGMLDSAFVYVLADKLGSETLLDQQLITYPAKLRENRQQVKIFIIPVFMSLMSLLFAFSLAFLVTNRAAAGGGGIPSNEIVKNTGVTVFYFIVVIVLVRMWNKNTSLLYRSIIAQLELLSSSEKDLTRRIHIASVDELGTMAGMVNAFCDGLSENISNLKAAQEELNTLGEDLGQNASDAAGTVAQVSASVGLVREKTLNQSTSVAESSSAVEQIAKNIESLDSLITDQASSVTEASASIEEMVANINSMSEAFKKTSEQFGSLLAAAGEGRATQAAAGERITKIAERSQSLLEANKVIATIASQTNLLAMNAAIEAAHAGNAGLGFSVVADEIRRLAETSAKQSGMIKSEIAQVQKAIEEVVSSSQDSDSAFARVSERIGETDILMREVRMAMEEQKEGSKQILEALRAMNDITSQVKVGSREMSEGNNTVLAEIAKLRGATLEIKDNIEEMAKGTDGIAGSALKVSKMAEGLQSTIHEMDSAISCFKTS